MKFRPLFLVLLALANAPSARADGAATPALRAMENGLWDVAVLRLERAAEQDGITEEERAEILLLLAENLVRNNQPAQALEVLERSNVRDLVEAGFWEGQALAGMGRFAEAVEILQVIARDAEHPLRREAALTAASLQLSLTQRDAALETLAQLADSKNQVTRVESLLQRVEILLNYGQAQEARELFSSIETIPAQLRSIAIFLNAGLLLAEGRYSEASDEFSGLLANPAGQTLTRYQLAAIGKADALAGLGEQDVATESLLNFIQSNPESALLEPMFSRIIEWLPEEILSETHPTLVRLAGWLPQAPPARYDLINTAPASAAAAWPTADSPLPDLAIFSQFARAIALHRIDTKRARAQAELLLQRLAFLSPSHFLAPRSWLTLAKWKLQYGDAETAFAILDNLRQNAKSPLIRGEAAFLDARIAYERGEPDLAASLFEEATKLLEGENRAAASLNAALVQLSEDPSGTFLIQNESPETTAKLNTELTLERALVTEDPAARKNALNEFLMAHPAHPRAAKARLAIVEAALKTVPPDLSLARAQLDTLQQAEPPLPIDKAPRVALAELRLLDLAGKNEEIAAFAKGVIERFPETHAASEASLILGKSLFKSGSYNEARLVLEKLATSDPGTQRSQAALLLAARAAALGATAQSREEALALFDRAIEIEGPLRSLAQLEKARLNIDLNHLSAAIASLRKAYEASSPDDPSRLPTGLMLAEAIYARGDTDPDSLGEAMKVYDQLIDLTVSNLAQYFRLQYLRGLTLEKLPDPETPGETRLTDALAAYFSVLDRPVDPPPPEWEWFERSGFRALALLEKAERWQAAISIAEKIASFKGPRSEEAATRARQIRLKQMIYDDASGNQ